MSTQVTPRFLDFTQSIEQSRVTSHEQLSPLSLIDMNVEENGQKIKTPVSKSKKKLKCKQKQIKKDNNSYQQVNNHTPIGKGILDNKSLNKKNVSFQKQTLKQTKSPQKYQPSIKSLKLDVNPQLRLSSTNLRQSMSSSRKRQSSTNLRQTPRDSSSISIPNLPLPPTKADEYTQTIFTDYYILLEKLKIESHLQTQQYTQFQAQFQKNVSTIQQLGQQRTDLIGAHDTSKQQLELNSSQISELKFSKFPINSYNQSLLLMENLKSSLKYLKDDDSEQSYRDQLEKIYLKIEEQKEAQKRYKNGISYVKAVCRMENVDFEDIIAQYEEMVRIK